MRPSAISLGSGSTPVMMLAMLLTACKPDQGLTPFALDSVAVVAGDFDRAEDVLTRLAVPHSSYEGYIVGAIDPVELDPQTPPAEALFSGLDGDGQPELSRHDALFLNSGVRGLGDVVYNGLEPDDSVVSDADAVAGLVAWVEGGGVLVASDWAYDIVEVAWPDAIRFVRESEGLDGAQAGLSETVLASVYDAAVADALDADVVALAFDFTYWTVMDSVATDVTVHLRGDVSFRIDEDQGAADLPEVPLLVSFDVGLGRVVLSSFHWKAQKAAVADLLLPAVVEGLPLGQDGA